jgi:hypothetical protein
LFLVLLVVAILVYTVVVSAYILLTCRSKTVDLEKYKLATQVASALGGRVPG